MINTDRRLDVWLNLKMDIQIIHLYMGYKIPHFILQCKQTTKIISLIKIEPWAW